MINLFISAIVFGTVILYGALGEILTEKSGNLNLGVPGVMYLGGIAGLASAFAYEISTPNPIPAVCLLISFVCAFLAAALGGLYYTMDYIKGTWASEGTIEALGWLAVALVIFAVWRSLNAIWGSYLFGFLTWLYLYVPQIRAWLIGALHLDQDALQILNLTRSSQELFKMLPYLATILVLILVSMRKSGRINRRPLWACLTSAKNAEVLSARACCKIAILQQAFLFFKTGKVLTFHKNGGMISAITQRE